LSLRACSPPPTLDVNRATRAVRARPVSGPLISFFISFRLVRDRARILRLLIVFAIVVSYRIVPRHPFRLARARACITHPHSLSLPLSFPPRTWCNELDAARPLNRGSLYNVIDENISYYRHSLHWNPHPGIKALPSSHLLPFYTFVALFYQTTSETARPRNINHPLAV
jgi:hypothetical protein